MVTFRRTVPFLRPARCARCRHVVMSPNATLDAWPLYGCLLPCSVEHSRDEQSGFQFSYIGIVESAFMYKPRWRKMCQFVALARSFVASYMPYSSITVSSKREMNSLLRIMQLNSWSRCKANKCSLHF